MKTINVASLKASLSRCLRAAQSGERFLVLDRSTPIAEIVPPPLSSRDPFARLASLGKVRLGRQDWAALEISPLKKRVPAQELLRQVRKEGR